MLQAIELYVFSITAGPALGGLVGHSWVQLVEWAKRRRR